MIPHLISLISQLLQLEELLEVYQLIFLFLAVRANRQHYIVLTIYVQLFYVPLNVLLPL